MKDRKNKMAMEGSILLMLLWLFMSNHIASASTFAQRFIDPQDGKFDVTADSGSAKGILPVPILITEPAIGYGAGAALLFSIPKKMKKIHKILQYLSKKPKSRKNPSTPPSYTGVVGVGNAIGTWAAGGFHFASWQQDRIRYKIGAIYSFVNLTFYGGGDSPVFDGGQDYSLEGWFLFQELIFRFKSSNFFLGPRLVYYNTDSIFDLNLPVVGISQWEFNVKTLGFGFEAAYDSLDNIFTPTAGSEPIFPACTIIWTVRYQARKTSG